MRFHVKPRGAPPQVAAKRLGLTHARFAELLPALLKNGFAKPDPVSGNFDLDAIDRYFERQNPELFTSEDEREIARERAELDAKFEAARAERRLK